MKTITEYRPMIFSQLDAQSDERRTKRRRLYIDFAVIAAYSLFGLWLTWDTGFAPWHWQFWTCFGPLFAAGEFALHDTLRA